ncbi:hypothetical protein [Afipia clevelandensis]|uniref:Uncharacterized protein n=1 Tax=Afipia clevelandensis ATCC 49720 TaxID=883079 RepID=K8NU93_9BRAD|nr:hypothetical protein [Afipia clevelandensis]EKS33887.1 hypothetical protein HMPREF9696_03007 [Afipia clevelandensis ATCC 49720]
MDLKLRGWNRDMGTHLIASHNLSDIPIRDDPKKTINRQKPGLFKNFGEVTVAWAQTLKFTGDYRMQIEFTEDDVFKLFRASYGRELDEDLLDRGFTISETLKKRILSEIKVADLTIGDLAKLGAASSDQRPAQTRTVSAFRKRS